MQPLQLKNADLQQHTHTLLPENQQGNPLTQLKTDTTNPNPSKKQFYIESYGCQMNFNDSEIVASILAAEGYQLTPNFLDANLILLNTCSIREKAEERIRHRLHEFTHTVKKKRPETLVGVLGCMAERLKKSLLEQEKIVDIVVGPDAYRDLPTLVREAETGQKAINVLLSREETYADVNPVRLDSNGVTAFVSIMRGCDNMCAFCVVPFTRGRERSRNAYSIIAEVQYLLNKGYKEVTLLGQNVDSYHWENPETNQTVTFAQLLELTAQQSPQLRVRFSTSHPKDMTDDVLHTIARYPNICNYIHLPVQSGSDHMLQKMNRGYDQQWYLNRIEAIRKIIPNCGISTDIITGFCGETEQDQQQTLWLMEQVQYDMAYMFAYSERPGTLAARRYPDDISEETKKQRLSQVIELQNKHSLLKNQQDIGKIFTVLIEKNSKRSEVELCGRNDQNKMVIFPKENYEVGQYVNVLIESCTSASLKGKAVGTPVF